MVDNDTASGEQVIFFDYTALLSDPGLLDLSHPKFSLWITQAVVKGLEEDTHPIVKSVRGKLDDAINARKINCNPVDFTKNSPLPDMFGIYADLLKHASLVKENGQRVTVVTVDPTMRQGAEALGLNVVDPNGLRSMIAAAVQAETEAREEAERERRRARKQVSPTSSWVWLSPRQVFSTQCGNSAVGQLECHLPARAGPPCPGF